jgi:hypothetical protein
MSEGHEWIIFLHVIVEPNAGLKMNLGNYQVDRWLNNRSVNSEQWDIANWSSFRIDGDISHVVNLQTK